MAIPSTLRLARLRRASSGQAFFARDRLGRVFHGLEARATTDFKAGPRLDRELGHNADPHRETMSIALETELGVLSLKIYIQR